MYLYIYDTFLNQKKYFNLLNRIENRLADLEIKGKICRLNILKNMKEVIEDGIKQGVETIVAVGNDLTFSKIVNIIAELNITLGMIPVTASKIAQILGVPEGEKACDTLAQRLTQKIDLGKINQQYFIDSATINNPNVVLNFEKFQISPVAKDALVSICNLGFLTANQSIYKQRLSNPTDGLLEAVIAPLKNKFLMKKLDRQSIFPFKKITIASKGEPVTITIDQQAVFKTPVEVTVSPKKLKVIVGNKRLF
ncbi:MAG: diacylglycerol kinase family protein [Candidatus Komeilibacteria bacterium]|nr:diacylglycerol kinase family protein [Candidatus Komeilibacteria bacterium]